MGINNRQYDSDQSLDPKKPQSNLSSSESNSRVYNFAKIFGFMFIGLLITGLVAFGTGALFYLWLQNSGPSAVNGINAITISSAILLVILTFVFQFVAIKGDKSLIVPSIVYTIVMGILLSTMTLYIDWQILGMAFLMTSAIFAIMALIAILLKGRVSGLAILGTSLFLGAGLVALFTWLITLATRTVNPTMYWTLDFIIFGAVMIITIVDISRIDTLTKNTNQVGTNLALYCAFSIYVDFIYIFIKIATYLAISKR